MDEFGTLWESRNYRAAIPFMFSSYIREYDISKANINALLASGYIDREYYNFLYMLDKKTREVTIGNLIRTNKEVDSIIQDGIIWAKRCLFESNSLIDDDILSIKNDAVFVINKELKYTEFNPYKFNLKNTYTAYTMLLDLEIYYGYNSITGKEIIDIKGINDLKLPLHEHGMIEVIATTLYMILSGEINDCLSYLSDIYDKYIKRQLPISYYRNFDADSGYSIISKTVNNVYTLEEISPEYIGAIDINRNLLVLRNLYSIVTTMYSSHNK